jgi:hypothetical protein
VVAMATRAMEFRTLRTESMSRFAPAAGGS